MLVDDSVIVRGLISRALSALPHIQIVASASNGALAIPIAKEQRPDIIILDIEMPEMDGITALPKLIEASPKTKVIMASTLTLRNAGISMQALSLGAADYVAKPSAKQPEELQAFYRELYSKILALAGVPESPAMPASAPVAKPAVSTSAAAAPTPYSLAPSKPLAPVRALAIASSTGGPQALQKLFDGLKGKLNHIPIFVTQHMPPMFTALLAEQLAKAGARVCAEGKNGERVLPGHIYVAPGDYHMLAVKDEGGVALRLTQDPPVNFCRPAADPMLQSLSAIYGSGLLTVVLTGMGQDGFEGARTVVANGGNVVAQDEVSSVVWGMPRAVAVGGLCRAVLPLPDISGYLIQSIGS
ncbi:MAG: chemotaxis response regulator protein-glutamate methylesterase [Alphaproteobacteria bacterium]|nr:chemotaxis response regulator protein-glutamate methylesterase [Alphaproteobacteria bacterium]